MHFIGVLFGGNEAVLEDYWEGLEVDSYIRQTKESVIDEYISSRKFAIKWRKERIAKNDPKSSEMQQWINEHPKLNKRTAWKKIKEDYKGYMDEDGNILSTYNPNSKWDWYVIGGRWSGYFPLKERDENGNVVWVDEATISDVNWELYKQKNQVPYCYITEKGNWEEREGFWGRRTESEEQAWCDKFFKELKSYPFDTIVTAIDFHI